MDSKYFFCRSGNKSYLCKLGATQASEKQVVVFPKRNSVDEVKQTDVKPLKQYEK